MSLRSTNECLRRVDPAGEQLAARLAGLDVACRARGGLADRLADGRDSPPPALPDHALQRPRRSASTRYGLQSIHSGWNDSLTKDAPAGARCPGGEPAAQCLANRGWLVVAAAFRNIAIVRPSAAARTGRRSFRPPTSMIVRRLSSAHSVHAVLTHRLGHS